MKKKLLLCFALILCLFTVTACNKYNSDISEHLIEERDTLFVANDELYSVSLSSGLREQNYSFDGVIGEKVDFCILTFSKNNSGPLCNDNYVYLITIGEESFTGTLTKSEIDNTYTSDLQMRLEQDAKICAKISFTGYTFDKELSCVSSMFSVDKHGAIKIANTELKSNIKNMSSKNYEVVMKLLKDHSDSEIKQYFWYVGVVGDNGEILGLLIDSNNGDIIAKKV